MNKITKADLAKMAAVKSWDDLQGETKGGKSDTLTLEVGAFAGPFTLVGARTVEIDGDDVAVHDASDLDGKTIGMPLAASFNHQLEDLEVKKGDVFFIRREADAVKKKGKGKGNKMRVFRLKVVSRA